MKKKRKNKKAQIKLSFGMIFSIILIILFIAFAFYAIQKFLSISDTAKTGKFLDNFQSDVNKIWKSSQASQEFEYNLPSKIEKVCLIDYSSDNKGGNAAVYDELNQLYHGSENLFFYPIGSAEGLESAETENIELGKITAEENPFCIDVYEGKIKLTLKKDYDEILVRIEK